MESKDRFAIDTNVIVRAVLIGNSRSAEAFHKARQRGEILLSLTVAEELNDVLSREKFDRYITREDRERFLASLIQMTSFLNSPSAETRLAS